MVRFLHFIVFLFLFQVGFLSKVKGQGCNLTTTVVIGLACTEGIILGYEDGIDCYSEIRMLLDAGIFHVWTANTTDGWVVEQLAPNELLVTHVNGIFPSGNHTMVEFLYYTPGGVPTQLILLYPDGCVMEGCVNQHMLPGCGESCISGTVYRECGAEPLTDQPKLEGFIVELSNDMGNLVGEYITGPDGIYYFCDLPPGNYIVLASKPPGWTARVPISGIYALELTPGLEEFRNFGSCPECDCDNVDVLLQEDVSIQDSSVYDLCLFFDNNYCVEKLLLEVDSGEIISWENLPADWEANLLSPTVLELTLSHTLEPCVFRVHMTPWGDPHEGFLSRRWTIKALGFDDVSDPLLCVDTFLFEHPSKYKQFTCCPDGTIQGPELVQNGQFFIITPPATDYNYKTTPSVPGDIAILSQANAYAANNAWVCGAVGGPLDQYLVVDGSSTGGLSVWKQQVTGLIANDSYVFCALFNNLVKPALDYDDPIVELVIEDDFNTSNTWSSGPLTLHEVPDNWEQLSLSWTVPSPASASYTLKIISHSTSTIGNDFAVDEIGFKTCESVPDPCCESLENFCEDLESGILFSFNSCKVTMDLTSLEPCYYLEWIDWGQGPEYGPWSNLTPPPMHSFSGSGTYYISFLAIALNDSNFICQEKVITDTLMLACEPCVCNEPNMSITTNLASYQLFCTQGAPIPSLPCPTSDIVITGFFGCETASGGLCEETAVHYVLTGPNGIVDQGFTTPFPSLTYTVNQIGTPGTYALTLSTLCPGAIDSCKCTIYWTQENCSPPCPSNLVPNPDFESFSNCPNASFQLPTLSWTSPTAASPDYYNSCAAVSTGVSTPINDFGNQTPRSGGGYVGLIMRPTNDYREYIETQLTAPLIANHVYQVSFYVNLADNSQWAVDEIGAYLSTGSVGPIPLAPVLNVIPQIKNPTGFVITDKNNWTLISGSYTALGGEDHIVIGNFSDNNSTTTIMGLGGLYPTSYYWIEDVEVCEIYAPPCPNNIVQNPGFWMGAVPGNLNGSGQSANWTSYGGSPQVASSDFCEDPYSIQMHDGEGICQTGFNFQQGHTYRISFCGRFWEYPNSFATSVNFAFVAANGCGSPIKETIGGSVSISNQSWSTYTLPDWTASQNLNTMWIRAFNVLGYTTFGRIDNICVEEVLPDSCVCGGFEDMFVRTPQGAMNMAVSCGGAPLTIPCPDPGKGFHLTGVFGCAGDACPPDHQIDWSLVHQSSGTTHSGGFVDNDPYFGIYILPTYISQPGIYTLTMTGYCNGDTCTCEIQFIVDCPNLCPCDLTDILEFSDRVDKGFAVALANKSCNACFSPLQVSDCETVDWYVNAIAGNPIGSSTGPKTFCYNFPFAGTYTIYMVVTRLKPDGTICKVFTYSKVIGLTCIQAPVCPRSIWSNPSFGDGAIAGNMNMGGEAPGWIGEGDHPTVLEGVPEAEDAWSILLTGCYFNSDLLISADPICLSKTDTGTITIRLRTPGDPIPGASVKVGRKPPGGNNIIIGYGLNLNQQAGHQRLAIIEDLLPLEDDDWYDLYIPFDLKNLESEDSCGDLSCGLPGHLGIWMSNMLSSDQGDGNVRDGLIMDKICMNGITVSTFDLNKYTGLRLYPNPTPGSFTLELPHHATPGTTFRIIGLTGQVLMEQRATAGVTEQIINTENLPAGFYFIQVWNQGSIAGVVKFVRQ